MWFVLFKVFRFGYSEAKKHKAKKQQQQQAQGQFQGPYPPHPAYIPDGNQPYPYPYPDNNNNNNNDTTRSAFPFQTKSTNTTMADPRPKWKQIAELALHICQFAFALAVVGLYSQDLNRDRDRGHSPNAKWVYAATTGFLASGTAFLYLVVGWWWRKRSKVPVAGRKGLHLPLFAWEAVLVILWLVVFGIFGEMYIGVQYEGGKGEGGLTAEQMAKRVVRMRRAVWVDLACLVFWAVSAGWRGVRWWKGKGGGGGAEETVVEEKEMV